MVAVEVSTRNWGVLPQRGAATSPGGRFVVEVGVPPLPRLLLGQVAVPGPPLLGPGVLGVVDFELMGALASVLGGCEVAQR